MNDISAHITYREATFSQTAVRLGIPNAPDVNALVAMQVVAQQCFEPARDRFGPIRVSSFYRSPALNKAIGGSLTSDHCLGRAIDCQAVEGHGVTNADLFHWMRDHLDYDQLIWEFGDDAEPAWVHVGYRSVATNRHQSLRASRVGGSVVYSQFEDV